MKHYYIFRLFVHTIVPTLITIMLTDFSIQAAQQKKSPQSGYTSLVDASLELACPELTSDEQITYTKPTVLIFYSPTCPACKKAKPHFNALIDRYTGSVQFWGIDSSLPEKQSFVKAYKITHIPTAVIIKKDGSRISSALSGADSITFLTTELPQLLKQTR